MIKLFGPTDNIFSSNGDKIIQATKAKVHKIDNGDFYLDLECSLDYINYIQSNNIIVAPTPQGQQAFRISNPEYTRTKIKAKCWHIFYDTENYLIEDNYIVDKDCNYALDYANSNTSDTSPFTTISNITLLNTYRMVRVSLYEATNEIINRWGGHLVRDNFTIGIMNSIGKDNGVVIKYGKNLKNISATYDWSNVVTKLMPVGENGLLLDEKYVYSDISYDIPYTKTVSFNQNVNKDNYTDDDGNLDEQAYHNALIEDLRLQAQNYVAENCIPKVNYTMSANISNISDIGDVIEVTDERLGIDLITNIISYEYDCILDKYTQLEFGNFTNTLNNLVNNITVQTNQAIQENNNALAITLGDELAEAQEKIWNALGSSYCIYNGDNILIVDNLPKESAVNCIMINSGGIAFSNTGINGPFTSAWTIDNVLNMEAINVINLTANLIKGGTLKLGSNLNQNGQLEIYDEANNLIAEMNNNGLKMYGTDGSYVILNNEVGFAGYDVNNNPVFWVNRDEFHMKKSVVEEEITLCNKLRFIPITIYDSSVFPPTIISDGIALVSVAGGV